MTAQVAAHGLQAGVQAYLDYLATERRLSPHTVKAYARDTAALLRHLRAEGVTQWREVSAAHLRSALAERRRDGLGARSVAREQAAIRGLFGYRQREGAVQARVERHAAHAGVTARVHPHMLRHAVASHVLESSGNLRAVQEMLGHADIASTQVYTHLDFQHLSRIYDRSHPRAVGRRRTRDDSEDSSD